MVFILSKGLQIISIPIKGMCKILSYVMWFLNKVFFYEFSRNQVSYFLSATIWIGILAFIFSYLVAAGEQHMILTFISHEVKVILAQVLEIVAMIMVGYFFILFIIGFFIDKEEKKSEELVAIRKLELKIDRLIERTISKRNDESKY